MQTYTDPFEGVPHIADAPAAPVQHDLATEKQVAFILKLATERSHPVELTEDRVRSMTKRAASATIEDLLASPRKAQPVQATSLEGVHLLDGEYVKVQLAKQGSGYPYAKSFIDGRWVYVGREPLSRLSEQTKLSPEQAAAFGHLYGECCYCARDLTDERSIEVGYGPVCAAKYGLPWG